jgi:hypothetical protein
MRIGDIVRSSTIAMKRAEKAMPKGDGGIYKRQTNPCYEAAGYVL